MAKRHSNRISIIVASSRPNRRGVPHMKAAQTNAQRVLGIRAHKAQLCSQCRDRGVRENIAVI